ncbi:Transcriptional regulatory protein dcuR [Raoultella terrigena]|uniref:Transcriptional regulatory protein dcuR n=1 Tax=Raoultella terrigena TaxID=577 RepID=A0A4U9D1K6_RAOTE|nr:Transcriptional regulatory protein dcuR [Raoultella terrigena]
MINDGELEIDLVLLDVYMQHDSGLDLLPTIRASGRAIDVIMITSAADAATVQTSMHYGVIDYLIKPFQFPRFEEALTAWREKRKLMTGQTYYEQADVDRLLHGDAPEATGRAQAAEGAHLANAAHAVPVDRCPPGDRVLHRRAGVAVNISRVSCRKYLIWLAQINILYTSIHYGRHRPPRSIAIGWSPSSTACSSSTVQ